MNVEIQKLSANEKLDLLSKWMRHIEIERICAKYRFNSLDSIKQYKHLGILLFEPHKPYLSFEEYSKNMLFFKLVAQ